VPPSLQRGGLKGAQGVVLDPLGVGQAGQPPLGQHVESKLDLLEVCHARYLSPVCAAVACRTLGTADTLLTQQWRIEPDDLVRSLPLRTASGRDTAPGV